MPPADRIPGLIVTSHAAGAGKTHVACALARWLVHSGSAPAPLHLSRPSIDQAECPGGGTVSRETALLAEACRVPPEPLMESGWEALEILASRGDFVVVESHSQQPRRPQLPEVVVRRDAAAISVNGTLLPLFQPAVTHGIAPELEGLPPWEFLTRPRTGVVSLPHLLDFTDLALLRGAEWLTAAGIGRFEFLVVPATSDAAHDAAWLGETKLTDWLSQQAQAGATVISCGWEVPGARLMAREDLTDYRRLSLLLGRRLPAPLPDDAVMDRLAEWIDPWARQAVRL